MTPPPDAHLVLCTDERFATGAWVAIWSAWKHWKSERRLVLHLLTKNSETPDILRIAALAREKGISLEIHPIDMSKVHGLPTAQYSAFAYLRLLAPMVLSDIDEFLYLDSDVLVRTSVEPLFSLQSEAIVSAVCEIGIPTISDGFSYLSLTEQEKAFPYFNSGVLFVNVNAWNKNNLTKEVLEFLHLHKDELHHADQDGLNAVLMGKIGQLDYYWNFQVDGLDFLDRTAWPESRRSLREKREELLRDAGIVHFIGTNKPWMGHLSSPYSAEYRSALLASGWIPKHEQFSLRLKWTIQSMRFAAQRFKAKALGFLKKAPSVKETNVHRT